MPVAFAQFDEPHAWLIRGLVEYGWPDVSRAGGWIPPGVFGGIDLSRLPDQDGRNGIVLEVPAVVDGQRVQEDGNYRFQAAVTQGQSGPSITLRCPEANFFQEFPYDPQNPTWAAGYIHQALTGYVPQFVRWRLQGGEVSWSQRAGIPALQGEPCSYLLARFIREKVQSNQRIDAGPSQRWWIGQPMEAGGSPASAFSAPIASVGKGSGDPVYLSAEAREALARGEPIATAGNLQALARVKKPGTALMVMAGLGMLQGLLWFVNAISVVAFYLDDSKFALLVSLPLSVGLFFGGAVAMAGAWRYRQAKGGPLPIIAMAYTALTPICCLFGIPITVWAALTWRDPMVKAARM